MVSFHFSHVFCFGTVIAISFVEGFRKLAERSPRSFEVLSRVPPKLMRIAVLCLCLTDTTNGNQMIRGENIQGQGAR